MKKMFGGLAMNDALLLKGLVDEALEGPSHCILFGFEWTFRWVAT